MRHSAHPLPTHRARRLARRLRGLAAGCAALAAAAAAFAAPAAADETAGDAADPAPVFVQNNEPDGNAVIAYERAPDGTLTQRRTYPTGGLGGVLEGSVVDHLASQGSLTYDHRTERLYAVNAGSDTITVFDVAGDRLERRQVIDSGGDFPVSVAVHGDLVYVVNALDGGSVQGFTDRKGHLVQVPAWHRELNLDPTLTPQFLNTPGQIGFTPDGSKIIVTTKGNGSNILVFPLDKRGGPSAEPVVNTFPGDSPFGFTFARSGRLVVAEAGPNAVATFDIAPDGRVTKLSEELTGEMATCWVVRTGPFYYASNAGSNTVSGFRSVEEDRLRPTGITPTAPGTIDASVSSDGRHLYVQTGGEGTVDAFAIDRGDGSLTPVGSVPVPGGVGGEGIVAL
ncbi:lactonase family protein [Streptomyces sp. SBT349]|uniref:lactonase family protein n=1 Tax=Streptomyces sp. SBT349 TaxID=1580539 RepID=UPI00066C2C3F|nr:beta-propeller fold lactonase family protein [Streptomyces sp. SBT349]